MILQHRKKILSKRFVVMSTLVFLFAVTVAHGADAKKYSAAEEDTDRGKRAAKKLVDLRSKLAGKYIKAKVKVTEKDPDRICIAVAKEARNMQSTLNAEMDIYIVRIVAEKYKNIENAAGNKDLRAINYMKKNPKRGERWSSDKVNGRKYYVYYKPIYAEKTCLRCHGDKKLIPSFIKKNYPDDSSYGFKPGDLMGAAAVYTWKGN